MEELYQDQETVIQQLRLLLAAKEEELSAFRGQRPEGGENGSLVEQLMKDLEERKEELEKLRSEMKGLENKAKERIAALADELDEKSSRIAALEKEQIPVSGDVEAPPPVDGTAIRELEEAFAAERENAGRKIASLEEQLLKQSLVEESAAEVGNVAEIEERLAQNELRFRTAQAQLHRLRISNGVLRGICGGLSLFLVFAFSMKMRGVGSPRGLEAPLRGHGEPVKETLSAPARISAPADEAAPGRVKASILDESGGADFHVAEAGLCAGKPEPSPVESARIAYTVQKGDSLWLICQRVLGNPEAMGHVAKENNITDPRSLKVGDVIYLSRR